MSSQPVRRKPAETANPLPATQPPPTRPQRVASSQHPNISTTARLELIQDSRSSIKDIDSAKKWLVEKELIIDGEDTTTACLTMALLYLACGKFSLEQLINGIRAVAICLESTSNPSPAATDSATIADRIIESLQDRLNTIEKKVEESATKVLATPTQSDGFPPLGSAHAPISYAAALASNAPPPNRAHHEVLLRSEIQTRQILLDGPKDGRGAANNLTEKELVTKANLAIELMGNDALTLRPLTCKVITATILRNKGVILEFSSAEGAEWVRNSENARLFEDNFGSSVSIKLRSYSIIVEFLPTSLADTLTDSIREIEDSNSLAYETITSIRWMKQPKNWRIGQQAAHAIFNLKQAEDANRILKNGIIIEGTRLRARKVEDDPQRCFKCQHYGHAAAKCNNNSDTCATCGGSHPSANCTESRRDKFNCEPCRTNNLPGKHAAWDSSCPVRIEEKKKLLTKRPENNYRYFVTNEAWTWTVNINTIPKEVDIICIQEPYLDFNLTSRALRCWRPVYPTPHLSGKTSPRALTLIHERFATDHWTQLPVDSLDLVALRIQNNGQVCNIYNIYNDCENSNTLNALKEHLLQQEMNTVIEDQNITIGHIWLGDFNRHHPMWDDDANSQLFTNQNLTKAEDILTLLGDYKMEMVLPKGIPTILNSRGSYTRPDNVFCSTEATPWIIACDTSPEDRPPNADHMPIRTILDFELTKATSTPRWNYRETDWETFTKALNDHLLTIPPPIDLQSIPDLTNALDNLERAIIDTIEQVVPKTRPSPHSKRWWTKELTYARRINKAAARRSYTHRQHPDHPAHLAHRQTQDAYTRLLKKTKLDHWEEWLDNLTAQSVWDAHRFTSAPPSDSGKSRIPALKTKNEHGITIEIQDNEEKSKLLHKAFFYDPPNDAGLDPNFSYPDPRFPFEEITDSQIHRIIARLRPYKAPGLNGISNSVLTYCADSLVPYLGPIFRAVFTQKHYPTKWKKYVTVALRKIGKTDYQQPNSYRPVALLDVIAKLLCACVKETLEYHIEHLGIFANTQFGNRPGCTTTDSLHMLTTFTKDAWRAKKEVLVVFLDVKGAFPNVVKPVLAHEMQLAGIPKEYIDFTCDKMTNRETVISFDDFQSTPIAINNGLDQGCTLSGIYYGIYNRLQTVASIGQRNELATTFADDSICATRAETLEENLDMMKELFTCPGGPLDWARTHFSMFEFHKFAACMLTRKRIPDPNDPRKRVKHPAVEVNIGAERKIVTTNSHKFLGVIIDNELRFCEQAAHAIAKGTTWEIQTRRLAKTIKGAPSRLCRQLYFSVALPSMLYAIDIWAPPKSDNKVTSAVKKMETIQRKIAIKALGALRTTPTTFLLAHANIPPLLYEIKKRCHSSVPHSHPPIHYTLPAGKLHIIS